MKRTIGAAVAAAVAALSLAACGGLTGEAVPTPTVTVTEQAPSATEPAPGIVAPSQRDQLRALVSEIVGTKVTEDDPLLDAIIKGTADLCPLISEGHKAGADPGAILDLIAEHANGDETVFSLVLAGVYVYCPAEFDWLETGALARLGQAA